MSKNWNTRNVPARIVRGCAEWLRAPQPRSGAPLHVDADSRRARTDLDAVRARFPDHA